MALIFDGEELCCEQDVRDWREHEFDTTHKTPFHYRRKRIAGVPQCNVLVYHWTGGERGHRGITGTLKKRKRGIHFTIDYRGTIWQYSDPALVVAPHVGKFNRYAIGVEIQSRGFKRGPKTEARFEKQAPRAYTQWISTDPKAALPDKTYVNYTSEQIEAALDLAEAFANADVIPRELVRHNGAWDRRIPKSQWPKLRGVGFHFQVHPSKLDAGPLLACEFEEEGW